MKCISVILYLIAVLPVAAANGADGPAGKRVVKDRRKDTIERPLKRVVARSGPPVARNTPAPQPPKRSVRKDAGKIAIERPLKRVVANGGPVGKANATRADAGKSTGFKNPKVEPGKVRWHANFDKAVAAAGKSRKPVLLFQMIGNLDERFS